MIELFLSSDGKHTVHVSAETPEELAALAPKAKGLYEMVVESYGNKAQMWQKAHAGKATAGSLLATPKRIDSSQHAEAAVAPRCPRHGRPMKLRQGAYGAFWSCPAKSPSGQWCSYTQEVSDHADEPASA